MYGVQNGSPVMMDSVGALVNPKKSVDMFLCMVRDLWWHFDVVKPMVVMGGDAKSWLNRLTTVVKESAQKHTQAPVRARKPLPRFRLDLNSSVLIRSRLSPSTSVRYDSTFSRSSHRCSLLLVDRKLTKVET